MFDNPFSQFVIELLRALLIDELSGHVRGRLARWLDRHGAKSLRRIVLGIHQRNRDRLMHRLRTEPDRDP